MKSTLAAESSARLPIIGTPNRNFAAARINATWT